MVWCFVKRRGSFALYILHGKVYYRDAMMDHRDLEVLLTSVPLGPPPPSNLYCLQKVRKDGPFMRSLCHHTDETRHVILLVSFASVSSVSVETQLRARRPGFDSLQGAGNFSLRLSVQISSGPHPASYPMGTVGSFPGVNAAGA
jgi:hypothetical protein